MSSVNTDLLLWLGVVAISSFAAWLRSMKAARASEDFATTRIRSAAQGDAARVSYWCPRCQPDGRSA